MKRFIFYLFLLTSLIACHSTKKINRTSSLDQFILTNKVFNDHFIGILLYDPLDDKIISSINSDKLFTPASNTKLLTFLTSINILGDSVDVIQYGVISKDSLVFRGSGYPMTLNLEALNDTSLIHFLKHRKETLIYCDHHFQNDKYGSGWAWDDALYSYQREINPLPIYSNSAHVEYINGLTKISPTSFSNLFTINYKDKTKINYHNDKYILELDSITDLNRFIPVPTSHQLTIDLLSNASNKQIQYCQNKNHHFDQSIKTKLSDSIYIRLLHQSDNFIAEQLLAMCSNKIFDTINTNKIIEFAKNNYFQEYQDMRWVDGSGLSRYNLISPKIMVYTLQEILKTLGVERIKQLFSAGGYSGTIKEWYQKENGASYVYAKTGTLSNNHNLSGYLYTKKKKILLFSFMNNHYLGSSKKVKIEMQKTLKWIHNNY